MTFEFDRRSALALAGGTLLATAWPAFGESLSFADWLQQFRRDAAAAGIREATLAAALDGIQPIQRVLDLDQHQPESTITFAQYIDRQITPKRVEAGRQRLADNHALLAEIGAHYEVQPRFIVALWGLETDFGAVTGNFPIVAALATLAWSSSRPDLFRSELMAALKILDKGAIQPAELRGSWAGAMGQTQFMPSSYLKYAVDYRNKGRADIWQDRADVFASIANYLSREGWNGDFTWGREVRLPSGFAPDLLGGKVLKPVDAWQGLGVRRADGGNLPHAALQAGIVQPGGADGPTLMTYGNYRVIMKWNRSTYFATSVSYLADRIAV
ncbi:MAG TPA: lytic murein transglycosylase [Stellaceae bacterium]|nr:lytic murein transglycosylase [Stellaceae bacterium]